ncbi:Protein of uncharacterised function (DUF1367) [Serratia rubidaea]|uniref:Protein of uncharacterized function (DUF1367) n=1 Tax=Serratia rubidaea TaxID=61652 RepID=A0A4U9HEM1_SERRU|nr:Protein of uncharacterised function (DUF1367) [Serratia rubidaea]
MRSIRTSKQQVTCWYPQPGMPGIFCDPKKSARFYTPISNRPETPAFHRKLFSLLNLGFDYWQPTGGAISPTDKALVNGYVKFLAYYAGGEDALQAAADEYLADIAGKRAGNISAAKSFEAFRAWVTIQAGFSTKFVMPDGTTRNEPKSISFAKMDDIEFGEFYKAVLDVLWNYILFRTFPDQQSAENAAAQLMGYTS